MSVYGLSALFYRCMNPAHAARCSVLAPTQDLSCGTDSYPNAALTADVTARSLSSPRRGLSGKIVPASFYSNIGNMSDRRTVSFTECKETSMPTETYKIVRNGEGWGIDHDGNLEGDYVTKEAAFESTASAASNAIKDGYGVVITVEPRGPGESSIGGEL